jgi:hypothetical protein
MFIIAFIQKNRYDLFIMRLIPLSTTFLIFYVLAACLPDSESHIKDKRPDSSKKSEHEGKDKDPKKLQDSALKLQILSACSLEELQKLDRETIKKDAELDTFFQYQKFLFIISAFAVADNKQIKDIEKYLNDLSEWDKLDDQDKNKLYDLKNQINPKKLQDSTLKLRIISARSLEDLQKLERETIKKDAELDTIFQHQKLLFMISAFAVADNKQIKDIEKYLNDLSDWDKLDDQDKNKFNDLKNQISLRKILDFDLIKTGYIKNSRDLTSDQYVDTRNEINQNGDFSDKQKNEIIERVELNWLVKFESKIKNKRLINNIEDDFSASCTDAAIVKLFEDVKDALDILKGFGKEPVQVLKLLETLEKRFGKKSYKTNRAQCPEKVQEIEQMVKNEILKS